MLAGTDREAIQQARAAGGDEVRLAATAAGVGRIPRQATVAIEVAQLRHTVGGFARPIAAGVIGCVRERFAFGGGAGQDVVRVRRVAEAVHGAALFIQSAQLHQTVADASLLRGIAVEHREILSDDSAGGVIPRSRPDAVARINRGLAVASLCAQVGMPRAIAGVGSRGQHLAMRIRSRESAEVGSFAHADAGDEKAHRSGRCFGLGFVLSGGLLCVAVDR